MRAAMFDGKIKNFLSNKEFNVLARKKSLFLSKWLPSQDHDLQHIYEMVCSNSEVVVVPLLQSKYIVAIRLAVFLSLIRVSCQAYIVFLLQLEKSVIQIRARMAELVLKSRWVGTYAHAQ
jgi:hypothetical protein